MASRATRKGDLKKGELQIQCFDLVWSIKCVCEGLSAVGLFHSDGGVRFWFDLCSASKLRGDQTIQQEMRDSCACVCVRGSHERACVSLQRRSSPPP